MRYIPCNFCRRNALNFMIAPMMTFSFSFVLFLFAFNFKRNSGKKNSTLDLSRPGCLKGNFFLSHVTQYKLNSLTRNILCKSSGRILQWWWGGEYITISKECWSGYCIRMENKLNLVCANKELYYEMRNFLCHIEGSQAN